MGSSRRLRRERNPKREDGLETAGGRTGNSRRRDLKMHGAGDPKAGKMHLRRYSKRWEG